MVTEEKRVNRVMDALGHQTRRDILALLKEAAMPVGDIAVRLPISRPAVSKHLRTLEKAGLVEYTSSGTRNIFRLRPSGFDAARAYVESFWDEALASFRQVAEEQARSER
ncbi:MAG TPA: metalloregulator ArsR/SmtB family transcription factor [Chloroflexia bacterium]|nr:metalloregulator ArsR/SmtB family transcription factor [Chloroflexia bacterium]